jgi:sec-independent protein translocase protein TatC
MTLVEHLTELRRRLAISLAAFVAVGVVGFIFFTPVFRWLEEPYCHGIRAAHLQHRLLAGGGHCALYVTSPTGAFLAALHVAILVGAVGSMPIWLWQLWRFITPGLRRHERRWAVSFVASSVLLFAAGVTFAFLVLPRAMDLLLGYGGGVITPIVTVDRYLTFLAALVLVFGVAFEFPLIVVMLNFAGVISAKRLSRWRRFEIFLVTAFAAIAVPSPDPLSMLACAVPMALLYEVAVLIARVHDRRKAARSAAAAYAGLADDETSPLELNDAGPALPV